MGLFTAVFEYDGSWWVAVYWNPANGNATTVPRHTEIADRLAMRNCEDLGIPDPWL